MKVFVLTASASLKNNSFKEGDAQGWMLLRLSLHDPVMPLNIEGARKGDVAKIKAIAKELLAGFDKLDMSCLD